MAYGSEEFIRVLGEREALRDEYCRFHDPILHERMLWRAQSFRHSVHLMPKQTILEVGVGDGYLTRQILRVSRGENPITAVTFQSRQGRPVDLPASVEFIQASSWPEPLAGRQFDFIVAMDLLDHRNCTWFLGRLYSLLKPGGQLMLYESNPWNVVLKVRRVMSRLFGKKDFRRLLSRTHLYELMSQIGFVGVIALYNDFVYAPLNRQLVWVLRNLSLILENTPGIQSLAGSILIRGQKPAEKLESSQEVMSLCEHQKLRSAISVVIPCHNEEMNVTPLVRAMIQLYGDYIHELILVDDNSQDNTAQVILDLASETPLVKPVIRTPPNGVGRALADGYAVASGQYVLSMDCDFTHLLPEFRDLFDTIASGCDVAVGSRFSRHSVLLNYPLAKILGNRAFHVLAQIFFHRPFRDLTNNLKIMRREVVQALQLTEPGFAANAETGLQPLLMGFSVHEVAISWINRTANMGVSSFKLAQVGGDYWRVLVRLAIKTRFGFRLLERSRRTLSLNEQSQSGRIV